MSEGLLSPRARYHDLPLSSAPFQDRFREEPLQPSFSYMPEPTPMDYYINHSPDPRTPAPPAQHEDATSQPPEQDDARRAIKPEQQHETGESTATEGYSDPNSGAGMPHPTSPSSGNFGMSHLTVHDGGHNLSPASTQTPILAPGMQPVPSQDGHPFAYQPPPYYSAMPFSTPQVQPLGILPSPAHHGHHPYKGYGLRSTNQLSRSPEGPFRPISPPLSLSPPGSACGSHNHSSTGVSPNLVSPMSMMSNLSDQSPHPHATLPHMHPQGVAPPWGGYPFQGTAAAAAAGLYTTTPLPGMAHSIGTSPPLGTGLSMVAGFPYPTTMGGAAGAAGAASGTPAHGKARVPPPRPKTRARANTTTTVLRKKESDADDDSDNDAGETVSRSTGLGFSAVTDPADDMVPVGTSKEEIKKHRIQSEQTDPSKRRRDELREGFRRLKDALPVSNQRGSKSNILDRSVAHIQSIEGANHYLLNQLEKATQELAKLRATNAELARAINNQARGTGAASPEPA